MKSFKSLGVCDELISTLQKQGIKEPTPIQEQSIPIVFKGNDIIAKAQTGTGKTFVYTKNTLFTDNTDKVNYLTTLEEHRNALKKCFKIAANEIIISSPFISINAINEDGISELIKETSKFFNILNFYNYR